MSFRPERVWNPGREGTGFRLKQQGKLRKYADQCGKTKAARNGTVPWFEDSSVDGNRNITTPMLSWVVKVKVKVTAKVGFHLHVRVQVLLLLAHELHELLHAALVEESLGLLVVALLVDPAPATSTQQFDLPS